VALMRFVTPTTPLSLRMICSAASRSEDESTCPERVTCPFSASKWIEFPPELALGADFGGIISRATCHHAIGLGLCVLRISREGWATLDLLHSVRLAAQPRLHLTMISPAKLDSH
jgi:hypothetical protein